MPCESSFRDPDSVYRDCPQAPVAEPGRRPLRPMTRICLFLLLVLALSSGCKPATTLETVTLPSGDTLMNEYYIERGFVDSALYATLSIRWRDSGRELLKPAIRTGRVFSAVSDDCG